jgi:hypothetical protein
MRFTIIEALALFSGSVAGLAIPMPQPGGLTEPASEILELRDSSLGYASIPVSGGVPILNDINTYRHNKGIQLLAWEPQLAERSSITGIEDVTSHWGAPVHDLKPPSWAQVIVAGINDQGVCNRDIKPFTPFQLSLLGWVCENPRDPAIQGNCQQASDISHIVDSPTDIDHWQILSNPDYNRIGCAFTHHTQGNPCDTWTGFWICDLGKA